MVFPRPCERSAAIQTVVGRGRTSNERAQIPCRISPSGGKMWTEGGNLMDPVQWLIDYLRAVQGQGPVAQIGLVFAVVAPILFVIAWVRRSFRRGYQEIEDENAQLTSQINAVKEALKNVRQENTRLDRERESLQADFRKSVLRPRGAGNRRRQLQACDTQTARSVRRPFARSVGLLVATERIGACADVAKRSVQSLRWTRSATVNFLPCFGTSGKRHTPHDPAAMADRPSPGFSEAGTCNEDRLPGRHRHREPCRGRLGTAQVPSRIRAN